MRIAFFHNLPSGGGKRSAYEWLKLMSRRHEVDLFSYNPDCEKFLDLKPLVRNHIMVPHGNVNGSGGVGRLMSLNQVRLASEEVARRMNEGNYDLAFIMQCQVSNSPFVLRHLRIPSLYFCHEPLMKILEPHCQGRWKQGALSPLKRLVINKTIDIDRQNAVHATLICANSLYSRENVYRAYGVYPWLTYPGVDPEEFHPMGLEREPMVLCVGTLNPSKGHDFVIESIGTLKKEDRPKVTFIYNSSYIRDDFKGTLATMAERLGVTVSFENLIADDGLIKAYNRASVTACPNRLEPFGLVPIESMACGTPVVGVAEGGIRETVQHDETGLFAERDPHEFGQAIHRLISQPKLRQQMGECGRQKVLERWSWEESYRQLEKNMQRTLDTFAANRRG